MEKKEQTAPKESVQVASTEEIASNRPGFVKEFTLTVKFTNSAGAHSEASFQVANLTVDSTTNLLWSFVHRIEDECKAPTPEP